MKAIIYLFTIAIGFAMCYASIQGCFKTSVAAEITTFCLGFVLVILVLFSIAEIIIKIPKR